CGAIYHKRCAPYAPNSCGLPLDLRDSLVLFDPSHQQQQQQQRKSGGTLDRAGGSRSRKGSVVGMIDNKGSREKLVKGSWEGLRAKEGES
ncbi:hypothetical protein HK104_009148, partial [Borealophlyctis nickersoniae]